MDGWRRAIAGLMLAAAWGASADPAPYPSRPIRWVVPYTPGGITDTVTRLVTARLQERLGRPIVVENRPGANSIVGADFVARSAPDGYTLVTVIAAHATNATLKAGSLPFDPAKSFAPVSLVGMAPLIMTVNNDVPARDVKALVAYARANPGRLAFGSSGVGASAHLTTELFRQAAGVDMVHVPYKGTAPALAALMSGEIQVLVDVPGSMMPHVRAGRVRALGLLAASRSPGAPEVPTIGEAGGPAVEGSTWVMVLAPAATPRPVVDRLSSEIASVLGTPEIRERLAHMGIEAAGSTPEQAARFLRREIEKWSKVIQNAGITAD